MKKKGIWIVLAVLVLAITSLLVAGDVGYWRRYVSALLHSGAEASARLVEPRMRVAGSNGEVPRASAESELIATAALQVAAETAEQQGSQALLVNRHGHRVFEYFAPGRNAAVEVEGGELSPALLALSIGALVDSRRIEVDAALDVLRAAVPQQGWQNPWSESARRRFNLASPPALLLQDLDGSIAETISGRVWLPLQAADAWLWGVDDSRLRLDCCVVARVDDWMRVGDLLLQQGNYQGERIVSPDWIRHLLAADAQGQRHPVWLDAQQSWDGDEPPAARDVFWFDLGPDMRLWLMPRRSLSVLHWAGGGNARDTLLPNIILRGLLDQAPAVEGANGLNEMVPGH